VRCVTRRPDEARRRWPGQEWIAGDVEDPHSLARALDGCDAAYYLVHGLASRRPSWAEDEARWAEDFSIAAGEAGVGRVVYLGGVAPRGVPSQHLRARLESGEALRAGPVPCIELRAAMIIGAGSASWTIVRDLAARLPAMVLPAWLRHRSEPVAVDDVVAALVAAAQMPLARSEVWDLPGPEALSGEDILRRVASVMGRRPMCVRVPLVSPGLSSHWIRLVTRADHRLATELIEGLTSDLLAAHVGFWRAADLPEPRNLEDAARRALDEEAPDLPQRSRAVEALAGMLTRPARVKRSGVGHEARLP
jgi:uncharacterized protein YbjT (DUF2867 family)